RRPHRPAESRPLQRFDERTGKFYEATRETAEAVGFYDNMRKLIPAIQAARIQIIIVPHHRWREGDYVGWKHMNPTQVRANQSQGFAAGSWGGEFHPEFGPRAGDVVVLEHWGQSGFANTDLDAQLTQQERKPGGSPMSASKVPYDANEFTGKRILVTGGTRGIGEAIVNRLVRGGGTVLATARTIPVGGNPEQFIQADVSTRAGADHVIKTTFDRLGGLDILINSVGGSSAPGGGVLALTDDIWQQEFELNLFSAVRLDRGFLPAMLKQRSGVIVHVSS